MSALMLRQADGAPRLAGGTVTYEACRDGRWVGWVGDQRAWRGSAYGPRRWWACHRETGDEGARWRVEDLITRGEAIDALAGRVGS